MLVRTIRSRCPGSGETLQVPGYTGDIGEIEEGDFWDLVGKSQEVNQWMG